jgi:pimeloyl-ACP methyl ester carboxylesterase
MKTTRALKRFLAALVAAVLVVIVASALTLWLMGRKTASDQVQDRELTAPKTGLYVDAGDARLHVQRLGAPDAPAMVFIHGTGSWSETWRASMEQAVALGYQAVALDLPPFGYSIPPASGDYSKWQQARRLLAALDRLHIARATFVAHSFGAAPVMEALLLEPQRATSLVLVDAALGLDALQTDGRPNRLQRLLARQWISEPISAALLTNPAMTRTLIQSFITEKDKASAEWVRLYQQPLALADSYRHVAKWLPQLVGDRGQERSDQIENYANLPFPVTLVWGETDTITPVSQARHLQTYLRGASLIVIPKAGHIPQIEEPEQFAIALRQAVRGEARK